MIVDELISATIVNEISDKIDYFKGIPVSQYDKLSGKVYLYNHLDFIVSLHRALDLSERIVEFDVIPRSIDWSESTRVCDDL